MILKMKMHIELKNIVKEMITGGIGSLCFCIIYLLGYTNLIWAKSEGSEMALGIIILFLESPVVWLINLAILIFNPHFISNDTLDEIVIFMSGFLEFFSIGFFLKWLQLKLRERDRKRGFY